MMEDVSLVSKYIDVLDAKIHYVISGQGDPIVFLHGMPLSSYAWRNIMPHLSSLGLCIAPDLVGCGKSAKPDIEYSIFDHIKYIDAFIEKLGLTNITFVMHGWGSVIGFHYAERFPDKCKGLVFYEAFLRSLNEDMVSLPFQDHLYTLKEQVDLDEMVANGSLFVDRMLPQSALQPLKEMDLESYRQPFQKEGSGKPIAQYIRDLPNGDAKSKVSEMIASYSDFLAKSNLPKLMLYSVPGYITTMATVMWARDNMPNIEIVDIGEELHLGVEAYPELMGETISVWLQGVESE